MLGLLATGVGLWRAGGEDLLGGGVRVDGKGGGWGWEAALRGLLRVAGLPALLASPPADATAPLPRGALTGRSFFSQ
jgi:hypothetical protein